MQTYSASDLTLALRNVGTARGDLVYLSTRLFGIGVMQGAKNRDDFLLQVYAAIREAIGTEGTLVVPTFTQQVGRYGLPYVHEETVSQTGAFGEFLRRRSGATRSLHPVFSVTADGPLASAICDGVSHSSFGFDSPFDRMVRHGGRAVGIGFERDSGHIVSLMHHIETMFIVPYYYNKVVRSDVFVGGKKIDRTFVINVKYFGLGSEFYPKRLVETLTTGGKIRSANLASGAVYAVTFADHMKVGFEMLRHDIYSFLDRPPNYIDGQVPYDGPPERNSAAGTAGLTD